MVRVLRFWAAAGETHPCGAILNSGINGERDAGIFAMVIKAKVAR